jgi:hypothetical protein
MSHVTGTVQPVSPVDKLGPDFGPATGPVNTWTLNFAPLQAPTGTKLVILHFTGVSLPASNRLEVDLGYGGELDVFTFTDGTDFWTRPININALAGSLVPIRYITNGAATGGVQLDMYGRGERHTKDPTNSDSRFDSLSNCDPFLPGASFLEPAYATFWFCNNPPNWENAACVSAATDIRHKVAQSVGMIVHVDSNPDLGFVLSTCTVTLVSPDTVITAGHCMADPIEDAKSASIIFNYQTNCDGTRPPGYHGRFFKVKEVIRQRYADGSSNDYCLLRLKVPSGGLGVTPIPIRSDVPAAGEQVFGIHHPNGAVKKLSIPHPGFATVGFSSSTEIQVSLDVAGGSSGSGLFDTAGRIAGVLSAGTACSLSYFPTATIQQDTASPPAITRDVMLVFDRSGSMSRMGTSGRPKIQEARAAASLFVQLVVAGTGNRVGLVSFSTGASSPVDFALSDVATPNKNVLIGPSPFTTGKIGALTPGGSTTIGGGLNAAYGQLTTPTRLRNVLLFTDGIQNTPPTVNPTDFSPTDIAIDVIGYGTPASLDGAMLTSLADNHHGQYVMADTNLKLMKFFALAFGNIFGSGLSLDPEFVLGAGQGTAASVPFTVCEEETVTVVVGWEISVTELLIQVTTPLGATILASTPGVEAASSQTWTFLRVPLPHNGERDGKWNVTVFRIVNKEFSVPAVHYFINVVASGGAVLRRIQNTTKYYTGDVINPLVGLQYIQGGLPPNAKLQLTVSRPDTSVGTLLSQEKLGAAVVIDGDTLPPRQATLTEIEQRTGRPAVGYMQLTFDLFDDVIHTNAPEPAGVFGNPLKDFLTMEGDYTFHVVATYGDTCTATRELLWSIHVDPSIDSSRTDVTVNISGGKGTITVVPRDQYGNDLGPGRGDGLSITGVPGTTVSGPVRDNGDGSYTVPVTADPSSDNGPGVVVGQPGRPPVVIASKPGAPGKDPCWKWKLWFWLLLLLALALLILWIFK